MIQPESTVQHDPRVVFRRLAGEEGGVLLHLDTANYHGVNGIGAAIWELSEDGPSYGTLLARLRGKLEDPPADLTSDVEEFLSDLAERGLIDIQPR
jgi:Coenzyme PQQ synthesis protein D (PqqD)